MYIFVSLEKVIMFFAKYGIDITLFSEFELSILLILSNIFVLLFYFVFLYILYRLIIRFLRWL